MEGGAYGDDSPYGSGSPYGGNGSVYQARFDFSKQKCQAIKIRITDLQSITGEGLNISGFTLQLGGKNGIFKLPTAKQFGVS